MLKFKLEDQDEISLPDFLGATSLSLAEIGAFVCFACLHNGSELPELKERLKTPEMTAAIESLREKGVFKMRVEGTQVRLEIDIEPVVPASIRESWDSGEEG